MIHETEQDYKRDSQNLAENEEQRNLRLQRLRESRSLEKVNPYEYKRELNSKDMTEIARDNTARRTTKQTPTASTKCCYVQREQEATTSTILK